MFAIISRWLTDRSRHGRRKPSRAHPRLEPLEGRLAPAVYNVNTLADLSIAAGVDPATGAILGSGGMVTLRSAIQAANNSTADNNSTVNLTVAGVYRLTLTGTPGESDNQAGELAFFRISGGGLTIANASGGAAVVDGGGAVRVFDAFNTGISGPQVTLVRFTIQNGRAAGGGAGVAAGGKNANLSLINMTFFGNVANGSGGAVAFGGSGFMSVSGLSVVNSLFLNNSALAGDGGAISAGNAGVDITSSEIRDNASSGFGGGLSISNDAPPPLHILNSTFAYNHGASGGGAIEFHTAGAIASSIANTTIAGNDALGAGANGGGLDTGATGTGPLVLLNDTIDANTAAGAGGGVFSTTPSFTVQNTIIARNAAPAGPDANGAFVDGGGNLIGVAGPGSGNTGFTAGTTQTGTVGAPLAAQLGPLGDNGGPLVGAAGFAITVETQAPADASPAVDKGVAAGAPAIDERGLPRPDPGDGPAAQPDAGALETGNVVPPPPPPAGNPPPSVSVAFGPFGQVVELVTSAGQLVQFDALGGHVLGGGVRAASVAFFGGSEVLLVTFQNGGLAQYDAAGAHALAAAGVRDASVAFGPFGEVIDVVSTAGVLTQFDAFGAHTLGGGVASVSVAFFGGSEVQLVATAAGALIQFDAAGAHALAGNVRSAGVAFVPAGEVLDVIFQDNSLWQFDPFGAHRLGAVP